MEPKELVIKSMKDIQCPICLKKMYYYRDTTNNYKCRKCGGEFVVTENEDNITVTAQ